MSIEKGIRIICATPAGSYVYGHWYQRKFPKIPPPEIRGRNDIVFGRMGRESGRLTISHSDRREESFSSLSGKKPLNLKDGQRLKDLRPLRGRELL